MFFALCPGPALSAGELYELLMFVASCCAIFVLALVAFVKWVDGRSERSAEDYSLGLNDR